MSENNQKDRDRRSFLSFLLSGKDNKSTEQNKPEMVKMLTAEGKLVFVDKAVLDKAINRKKADNKDIFDWMNNPSKDQL
jgi:hypothetical protein